MDQPTPTKPETVLNIKLDDLKPDSVNALLEAEPAVRFIHIDHGILGSEGKNLIELARKHAAAKEVVVALANRKFMAYTLRGTTTSFVHYERLGKLWKRVTEGPCKVNKDGLIYSIDPPLGEHKTKHLLVVFSSMAGKIYTASMMRHFEQNFASVQKYMPAGTAVLRIADLGGVVGGYYMNTIGLPDNERHIQDLIRGVISELGVGSEDVCLYGVSKGGTASLYHGLLGGYRIVAVDPILADEHYIKKWRDSHFTVGVFPHDKREKFRMLCDALKYRAIQPAAIICSQKSPQYEYITNILDKNLYDQISVFNSLNPDIKTHPDVSPKTLNVAVMLMNALLYRVPVAKGMHIVDDIESILNSIDGEEVMVPANAPEGGDSYTETIRQVKSLLECPAIAAEDALGSFNRLLARARSRLSKLEFLDEDVAPVAELLGRIASREQNHDEAVNQWLKVVKRCHSVLDRTYQQLGGAYASLHRFDDAKSCLERVSDDYVDIESVLKVRKNLESKISIESSISEAESVIAALGKDQELDTVRERIFSAVSSSRLPYSSDVRVPDLLCAAYATAGAMAKPVPGPGARDRHENYKAFKLPLNTDMSGSSVIFTSGFLWSGSGAVTDFLLGHPNVDLALNGRELDLFHLMETVPGIFDGLKEKFGPTQLMRLFLGAITGVLGDRRRLGASRNGSVFKAHVDTGGDLGDMVAACSRFLKAVDLSNAGHAVKNPVADVQFELLLALRDFCGDVLNGLRSEAGHKLLMNNSIFAFHVRLMALFDDSVSVCVARDPRDQYVSQYYERPARSMPSLDAFIKDTRRRYQHYREAISDLGLDDRVIEVRFESFVQHSHVREGLLEKLGLSGDSLDRSRFRPEVSAKNIGIYKDFADQDSIRRIAGELADLCYLE